jgi:glycosyltransferase involved in cell wall biosynthesis
VEVPKIPAFILGRNARVVNRTRRALANSGCEVECATDDLRALADHISAVGGMCVIAGVGVWFPARGRLPELPPRGVWMAVGAWIGEGTKASAWDAALAECGGDFSLAGAASEQLCAPPAMLLSPDAAQRFAECLRERVSFEDAWRRALRSEIKTVHFQELDGCASAGLRVLQLVTSIQIGGAERVTLDLAAAMPALGVATLVVAAGRPLRESFPAPPGFVDLSALRGNAERLACGVRDAALSFGADVVHAHLIRAAEARAIVEKRLPLILHIHNFSAGWPPDYATMKRGDATLLAACAMGVEREVSRLLPQMPVRTVWNGIAPVARKQTATSDAFTVVTLANPRPQKRLERIPAIARATAEMLAPRRVRFVIAGARDAHSADSATSLAALDAAIAQHGAEKWIERPGLIADPAALLAEADAMLSVSDYEGLSLAHLEALSAGVPLVATDACATREIAAQSAGVTILPCDAPPQEFACALSRCRRGTAELPPSFSRQKMAARAAWLAAAVARTAAGTQGEGLWLIANNFSTGGAQSSARRLLNALKDRGVRVRAATIQEQSEYPTPGRRALLDAGIPVLAVPPADGRPVEEAAEPLLEAIAQDPPQAVFFWNVITSWKVLLTDALPGIRIFDISPGEMLFSSLERFFSAVPAGLPYREPRDYGLRLAGMVVKYHAESARAAELGAPVSVIRNGIALSEPVRHGPRDIVVLGTAARLSPDKRVDELLRAVRIAAPSMPPFVLRIAGGPERDFPNHAAELRALAEGLPVEWCGEIEEIRSFLGALDVFVMISEPAGCPNATLEAAAAGLPVIATDHGGASEQVIDGLTGRVVGRGNCEAFAEAIIQLARDVELRGRFGEAGRRHVAANFSMSQMTEAYLTLVTGDAPQSR